MDTDKTKTNVNENPNDDGVSEAIQDLQIEDDKCALQEDASQKYFFDFLAKYKEAVKHKEKHSAFLRDSVVGPFLVLCLGSKDEKIVLKALEIIEVLLENVQNHHRLQNLLHFLDAALDIAKDEAMPLSIRSSAAQIYELVKNATPHPPLGPVKGQNVQNVSSSSFSSTHRADKTGEEKSSQPQKSTRKSGKPVSSARVTHLNCPSVVIRERRTLITNALVKVDGIISVTYNVNKQQCIIRAKSNVSPKGLGLQIANLGFDCSLITKNEKSEEALIPIKPQHDDGKLNQLNSTSRFEKENVPQYFPEDDDVVVSENAVAPLGFNDEKEQQGNGWFSSASKLIRTKLFW